VKRKEKEAENVCEGKGEGGGKKYVKRNEKEEERSM
jgi:hypothetical protein